MGNYIPTNDLEFDNWQTNLVRIIDENTVKWIIGVDALSFVKEKQSLWSLAVAKTNNKNNRTPLEIQAKVQAYNNYVSVIRPFVTEWITNNSKVTDTDRMLMGLNVKSGTRALKPKPTSCPVATIDFSARKQHTISYYDENSSRSRAKPEGVHGCEIYCKVDGEGPQEVTDLNYLGTCTSSPYVVTFDGSKSSKIVYYWLRWVNTRGECGPWSTVVSAMVVG